MRVDFPKECRCSDHLRIILQFDFTKFFIPATLAFFLKGSCQLEAFVSDGLRVHLGIHGHKIIVLEALVVDCNEVREVLC